MLHEVGRLSVGMGRLAILLPMSWAYGGHPHASIFFLGGGSQSHTHGLVKKQAMEIQQPMMLAHRRLL